MHAQRKYRRGDLMPVIVTVVVAVVSTAVILRNTAANAASLQRSRPGTVHLRARQHVSVRPSRDVTGPRFAVPGWTDEQTLHWLDNASSGWAQA
jgi:hypothetical protein